ncbi:tRNA (guanosine(37)-N1)-methyltransferase TrmD [Flammeovirga kamogawensis]|uniref:tRNA (guanine-N(1)-)-methyltransferase n=1 Tax=Flammeovirga kamogawensis TaxID=373891 RepID=A0ABX8GRR4_9BACT|nr:tRNA (guanosine(37)-N1)-methyltransferase TrmD [Flammeovirga kamogawensis]MBB6463411.1 tRNA (guanine37-N1)-methyltransferase [Flammeovirga kamogawensis]QWG05660.1 tRNA (guanosine(37)-N1)-methyltransferase TrmD [Flammeovirga kamogawensis]TRX67492.1 tRNA (guanosine(37)-N1)-methyltransferase TrmD [Flammeovirga kamogawensis]
MRIDIISCVPKLLDSPFSHSILQRANNKALSEVHVHDLRKYANNKHNRIDDYAYGHGAGMVIMADPIFNCINDLKKERDYQEVIYMTPDGEVFNQQIANHLSISCENIIILCGHYKGIDQRVRDEIITREISIGDYVLSGGELAAAIVADAVIRLLPGVLGDETSALTDSFQDGLLAPPVYTRPKEWKGQEVPDILLSGHESKIDEWRLEESVKRTQKRRPDLWDSYLKAHPEVKETKQRKKK